MLQTRSRTPGAPNTLRFCSQAETRVINIVQHSSAQNVTVPGTLLKCPAACARPAAGSLCFSNRIQDTACLPHRALSPRHRRLWWVAVGGIGLLMYCVKRAHAFADIYSALEAPSPLSHLEPLLRYPHSLASSLSDRLHTTSNTSDSFSVST